MIKYLEEEETKWINSKFSECDLGDRLIKGCVECFSCTKSSEDIYQNFISIMNTCFIDYDFTCVKPTQFHKQISIAQVRGHINFQLAEVFEARKSPEAIVNFWTSLDNTIDFDECEIYSYDPDNTTDEDPLYDRTLWSFCYFFYNRHIKKILILAFKSKTKLFNSSSDENYYDDDDDDMEDDEDDYGRENEDDSLRSTQSANWED